MGDFNVALLKDSWTITFTMMGDFNVDLLKDNADKVEQQQLPWWEILMLTC